jgi:hypothetical protein
VDRGNAKDCKAVGADVRFLPEKTGGLTLKQSLARRKTSTR